MFTHYEKYFYIYWGLFSGYILCSFQFILRFFYFFSSTFFSFLFFLNTQKLYTLILLNIIKIKCLLLLYARNDNYITIYIPIMSWSYVLMNKFVFEQRKKKYISKFRIDGDHLLHFFYLSVKSLANQIFS